MVRPLARGRDEHEPEDERVSLNHQPGWLAARGRGDGGREG